MSLTKRWLFKLKLKGDELDRWWEKLTQEEKERLREITERRFKKHKKHRKYARCQICGQLFERWWTCYGKNRHRTNSKNCPLHLHRRKIAGLSLERLNFIVKHPEKSLRQLGIELGISYERVRQLKQYERR